MILRCLVQNFFGHSHLYKVPFFATDLLRFLLATVIFIRRIFFILRCLVQIFLGTVIFIRCHFFQLLCSDFFGNSHFLRRIFYPTLFGSDFLGRSHFYKVNFLFNCFAPIFFAAVIFIRCVCLSLGWLRFFSPQSFL